MTQPSSVDGDGAPARPSATRVSLLGGFGLHLNGEAVELPHSAARLICFLAVHRGALMRMYVAGSLWTDASEEQANSSLRSVLWRLRSRSSLIDTTSTHLSLAPSVQTDLADWSGVVQRVRDHAVAPTPADVIALTEAGELLPEARACGPEPRASPSHDGARRTRPRRPRAAGRDDE